MIRVSGPDEVEEDDENVEVVGGEAVAIASDWPPGVMISGEVDKDVGALLAIVLVISPQSA